jgi:hypothetical protein
MRTWDVLQCEITGEDDAGFPAAGGSGEWARAGSGVGLTAGDGRTGKPFRRIEHLLSNDRVAEGADTIVNV